MVGNHVTRAYQWACGRLYHELAWSYDVVSWLVSLGQWNAWRRLALEHVRGPQVLELGIGTGKLLAELARREFRVVGIEPSSAMHMVAAGNLRRRALYPGRVQARAQFLPFADETFDSVVSTFPAPYILEPVSLAECKRVLRPPAEYAEGGRLVIVGLWVQLRHRRLRPLVPLFYGAPGAAWLDRLQKNLTEMGMESSISERAVGFGCVGVVTARRKG